MSTATTSPLLTQVPMTPLPGRQSTSELTARREVGALLDIKPATLRNWVERQEIDSGERPGVTSEASEEVKALRREVAELRRANEILKTASAFFAAAELDRRLK